jgi:hypothetical protein
VGDRIDATGADLTPTAPAREVVSTSRREAVAWKRTERRPPADWIHSDFDASSGQEAPGGFGTRGTPGAVVRSEWRSRDIWLRRMFTLREADLKALALLVHHDEDAETSVTGQGIYRFTK